MTITMNGTLLQPTLTPLPPILPPATHITDHWVLLILPIVTYWAASLFFHYLDTHDLLVKYRLHTPEELLKRNHVTPREVVRDVILQQIIQTIVGGVTALFEGVEMIGGEQLEVFTMYSRFLWMERWGLKALALLGINGTGLEEKIAHGLVSVGGDQLFPKALQLIGLESQPDWRYSVVEIVYWYMMPVLRLGIAIFILDTWQYFLHRAMHESKWLYKTFHSRHHRLYVPYAFGALYNHPFEGLLMDTIGAGLGYKLSGMRTRGAMFFFCFSTLKTVDDHCGYSLPWDPLQKIFWNNAGYHDVHHQTWGIKNNYSQPFLICWDRWLGTQWTGGDASAKYAASRERAAAALTKEASPKKENGIVTNGHTNGATNGATNGVTNGVTNGSITKKFNEVHATNGHATNGFANGNGKPIAIKMNGNGALTGVRRELTPSSDEDTAPTSDLRRSTRKRIATRAA